MIDPIECPAGTHVVCIDNGPHKNPVGLVHAAEQLTVGSTYIIEKWNYDVLGVPGCVNVHILGIRHPKGNGGFSAIRFKKKELPEEISSLLTKRDVELEKEMEFF